MACRGNMWLVFASNFTSSSQTFFFDSLSFHPQKSFEELDQQNRKMPKGSAAEVPEDMRRGVKSDLIIVCHEDTAGGYCFGSVVRVTVVGLREYCTDATCRPHIVSSPVSPNVLIGRR